MEKENLNTPHVNQIYEVSRKYCGKLKLAEIPHAALGIFKNMKEIILRR